MKEYFNAAKNASFGCCLQKLSRVKVFMGICLKLVSSTWIDIDVQFDVQLVKMVIWGNVQFWVYPLQ